MVERLTYVRSTYVMCGDLRKTHLLKFRKEKRVKQIEIFLQMIPPTATQQEKKINFKTKAVYQSDASRDARSKIRAHLVQHIPAEPLTGPIRMDVIWGFPESGKHPNGSWHIQKPDLDNLQKTLQDVMTELEFFKDDKQICRLNSAKIYTYHPGILIILTPIEEGDGYEDFSIMS